MIGGFTLKLFKTKKKNIVKSSNTKKHKPTKKHITTKSRKSKKQTKSRKKQKGGSAVVFDLNNKIGGLAEVNMGRHDCSGVYHK